jgi:hypothetical protein
MNLFLVFAIALALAMDAFAVSVGITQNILVRYIEPFDHWVAFSLLVIVGGKMIYESFKRGKKIQNIKADSTKGISLDCPWCKDRTVSWPVSRQKSGTFGGINPYSDRSKDSLRSFIIEIEEANVYKIKFF